MHREYEFLHFPPESVRAPATIHPPSAAKVFESIAQHGPMTPVQLERATGMPGRTIRYAIQRLRSEILVDSVPSRIDARTGYVHIHPRLVDPAALVDAQQAMRDDPAIVDLVDPEGTRHLVAH